MRFWSFALLMALGAYGISQGADARSATAGYGGALQQARMPVEGTTDAPIGHVRFCFQNPRECQQTNGRDAEVYLTKRRWNELKTLNERINASIKPVSDDVQYKTIEYWTYPTSGKGDCEDYVLLKKRRLIEMGWPESALLITVVRDEHDEGHAVLTVRTHRGDLILDNKHSRILAWHNTPYTFIKRQSPYDARSWNSLVPQRSEPTVSASGAETRR